MVFKEEKRFSTNDHTRVNRVSENVLQRGSIVNERSQWVVNVGHNSQCIWYHQASSEPRYIIISTRPYTCTLLYKHRLVKLTCIPFRPRPPSPFKRLALLIWNHWHSQSWELPHLFWTTSQGRHVRVLVALELHHFAPFSIIRALPNIWSKHLTLRRTSSSPRHFWEKWQWNVSFQASFVSLHLL